MDSRIDPLRIVGMAPGDVKILRNAGARVTDDVLRTLVLATYLLDVTRVLVLPHTRCKMVGTAEEEIHAMIAEQYGVDTYSMEFRTVEDEVGRPAARPAADPQLPAAPRATWSVGRRGVRRRHRGAVRSTPEPARSTP